jgi:hypothetical protein
MLWNMIGAILLVTVITVCISNIIEVSKEEKSRHCE